MEKKTMRRDYTMYEGLINWYTKNEYKDLMQSSDEQGKGDVIEVPATKTNILDAVGQTVSCNYGVDPDGLSKNELLVLAKKLGYLFN